MKLLGNTKVLVPWFDTDGNKHWMNFKFSGDVDIRRVFREVQKHIRASLQRTVSKKWIKANCLVTNDPVTRTPTEQDIQDFIQRMVIHEDEDGTNSAGAKTSAEEAGRPMCSMQD